MTDHGLFFDERRGRIAGIDYGTRRIGVAITDRERRIASPWQTYQRVNEAADAKYFREFVASEEIILFVVGLPVHLSGEESEKSRESRAFGSWLGEVTGVPVEWFDERFSSQEADSVMDQSPMSRQKRAARRDKLAAQVMLSAYLDSSSHDPPTALDDD